MKNVDSHDFHRQRGELISLDGARAARNETIEATWQRFVDAKMRAERSLRIEDAIVAGKAYRDFLELFARAS